jgi:hypothetical protein
MGVAAGVGAAASNPGSTSAMLTRPASTTSVEAGADDERPDQQRAMRRDDMMGPPDWEFRCDNRSAHERAGSGALRTTSTGHGNRSVTHPRHALALSLLCAILGRPSPDQGHHQSVDPKTTPLRAISARLFFTRPLYSIQTLGFPMTYHADRAQRRMCSTWNIWPVC